MRICHKTMRSLGLVLLMTVAGCAQQIIDPTDPRFDRTSSLFDKYEAYKGKYPVSSPYACQWYFQAVLPIGTEKAEVDKILLAQKGVSVEQKPPTSVIYHYAAPHRFIQLVMHINIKYDGAGKVSDLDCIAAYKGP